MVLQLQHLHTLTSNIYPLLLQEPPGPQLKVLSEQLTVLNILLILFLTE
jgi:hypothetical protein